MFNITALEVLVLALVALIVLGPDKLPEAARKAGHLITEVRRMSSGFQAELRDALQEPVDGTPTIERSETPKARPAEPAADRPADEQGWPDEPWPDEPWLDEEPEPDAEPADDATSGAAEPEAVEVDRTGPDDDDRVA